MEYERVTGDKTVTFRCLLKKKEVTYEEDLNLGDFIINIKFGLIKSNFEELKLFLGPAEIESVFL